MNRIFVLYIFGFFAVALATAFPSLAWLSLVITHIVYSALKSDMNVVLRGATFMSLLPAP